MLVGVIISLTFLEGFLYLKYQDTQIGDAGTPSERTFYRRYYQLNSQGFRDSEFEKEKGEDTFRIAFVGDSFTYGSGIKDYYDTYPKVLEELLNKTGNKQFESYNFARRGYDTNQVRGILNNEVLDYDPDLVIYGFVLNDVETKAQQYSIITPRHPFLPKFLGTRLYAMTFTYYIFVNKLYGLLESKALPEKSYVSYIKSLYSDENQSNLNNHKKEVEMISNIAQKSSTPVLVLLLPIFIGEKESYHFYNSHIYINDLFTEYNIEVLDLLDYLEGNLERYSVSEFDSHPNSDLHQIAASVLFEKVITMIE